MRLLSFRMPFKAVPCHIWLPTEGTADEYNNAPLTYAEKPDIETTACYSPGGSSPETSDEIEDGRPHGARVSMTFYLPKTVTGSLREALIAVVPPDDTALANVKFKVVGEPYSYSRANTPGDYSWCVEGVTFLG